MRTSVWSTVAHLSILVIMTVTAVGCGTNSGQAPAIDEGQLTSQIGIAQDGSLEQQLESIRLAYNMPAIAAISVKDGNILEVASTGYRNIEAQTPVANEDRWAIGSFTKSITALVAARLVEQELIGFDTLILDILPELKGKIKTQYQTLTLKELLNMTSGLPRDVNYADARFTQNQHSLYERRAKITAAALNENPAQTRGQFLYSNVGYIIAGHILERVANKAWEELVEQEVFQPLGITRFGFGEPSLEEDNRQPSGHLYRDGKWHVVTELSQALPLAIGPAGSVNISLLDIAAYLNANLEGMQGSDNIINQEHYKTLFTPYSQTDAQTPQGPLSYGMGWLISHDQKTFRHGGYTQTFRVDNLFHPESNSAFFVAVNGDTENSKLAVDKALQLLIDRVKAL